MPSLPGLTQQSAPPRPRRRPLVGLPLAWAALVLVLTLTPSADMPVVPPWELISFDTAAHAGVFVVLAALVVFSARRQTRWPALRRHAYTVVLLGCVAFGLLIELLQMTMALGRHGEWSDAISDALGAALGLGLAYAIRRWWQ
ncbi:VanZ family protein [Hymenobacter yonginensis]|uniref:VanZ family protein n=1 Tax=Hymenobacter yonginensis TaxID=748197 RepID=A0ABY7PK89_9BACT|nr:VanZ family protein [Hymenobacter yonginensis]WBO83676.1 VanZ family protein [Hymenobacter yonginensis]